MTKQHLNNTSKSQETTRKSEKYCAKCSRWWGDKLYNVVSKTKDSVVIMTKHNIKKNCEGM